MDRVEYAILHVYLPARLSVRLLHLDPLGVRWVIIAEARHNFHFL